MQFLWIFKALYLLIASTSRGKGTYQEKYMRDTLISKSLKNTHVILGFGRAKKMIQREHIKSLDRKMKYINILYYRK